MKFFKLNNGFEMPMAGIGVFTFTETHRNAPKFIYGDIRCI